MGQIENTTIAAVSTPAGSGGIAVLRISGPEALNVVGRVWKGKDIRTLEGYRSAVGYVVDNDGHELDQAVATVFRAPHSFTGEDVVELSIHGSVWLQREILHLLIDNGAVAADRGEFSKRAFMNGKLDLAQAEGIADLIAASSRASHRLALSQLKGGFSRSIEKLREQLIDFASLLELELDFSEEDVEFADRQKLLALANEVKAEIQRLADSYRSGRVYKEGVPVVIAGIPNAGKSTLLNALVEEDKAIVTDIPGTTRDIIEDTLEIGGVLFRFIDTAGLRATEDVVEKIGVERSRRKIKESHILLWLTDPTQPTDTQEKEYDAAVSDLGEDTTILRIETKADCFEGVESGEREDRIRISGATGYNIDLLKEKLGEIARKHYGEGEDIMVTNSRHYEQLKAAQPAITRAIEGIETGLSGDFIAQDIREVLHHLSAITGQITTDTLLQSIFTRFCIGK